MIKDRKIGEVFLCGPDTMGVLALADHFLGRVVSGLGGGGKKIFVMEEGDKQEGLVSPLHPSQYDLNPDNIINTATIPPEMEVQSRAEEIPDSGPFPIEEEKKEEPKEEHSIHEQVINEDKKEQELLDEAEKPEAEENQFQIEVEAGELPAVTPEAPLEAPPGAPQEEKDFQPPFKEEPEEKGKAEEQSLHDEGKEKADASVNDNLGYLVQICAGKQHILHLTEDGHVYSYGSGIYGVCGQGGAACSYQHQILRSLSERKVLQIACGDYHSLALTESRNIYSWGRGFEGQLGITQKKPVEIATRPTFIPFFDKIKVGQIAAGSYYSLAITNDGELYGWGEARLGQLGCGKQRLL